MQPRNARNRRRPRPSGLLQPDWVLLALLGFSLAIRLWGIGDRLPDPSLGVDPLGDSVIEETDRTTMGRAWTMWQGGAGHFDLNPHTGGWPALSFYLSLLVQYLYRAWFFVIHPGTTASYFGASMRGEIASLFLVGRIVGVLLGVATVALTYVLASRYVSRSAGIVAGFLVGTNTLHVLTSQHISDPNLLALLFTLLATVFLAKVAQGGGVGDSIRAGAMIGLAGACKYVPLVLALPFALAHGSRGVLKNRGFWLGLLAIPAAMFLASPFLFLDWRRTLIDIGNQRQALFSDWVGQTTFPLSLPSYLSMSLPHAMGWAGYLLGIGGLVLLWRAGGVQRLLASVPILIVLVNGLLKSPQERYVLVALPYLCIGAALALTRVLAWARERIAARTFLSPRTATAILTAGVAAWPLTQLVATRHSLRLPDSRHLSRQWIRETLEPGKRTVLELYGPAFDARDKGIVVWPFFASEAELARPAYHSEFLDGIEYYVASEEVSRRFEAEPAKYPVENAYYGWMRRYAPAVWESDVKSTSGPHIVIRHLPAGISTRAQRDSVFAAAMPKPSGVDRVALWCADCSRLFAQTGDYDRAEEWARRGLQVGVESRETQLRSELLVALQNTGRLPSAEAETSRDVQRSPRDAALRLYHGDMLAAMGRLDPALEEFHRAFQLSGGDPRIHLRIARALGDLGRIDEAVQELRLIPAGHPDRARALRNAALYLVGDPARRSEARDLLRESIRLDPNQEEADALRQQLTQLEAQAGNR